MDAVINDVFERQSDIGVISITELTEKIICRMLESRDLQFHEIASVDPCIYVRAGHPVLERRTVTEEDLAPYPLRFLRAGPGGGGGLFRGVQDALHEAL